MTSRKDTDAERAALTHLKKAEPRLHAAAQRHRGAILSRVKPKRTNAALFVSLAGSIVSQQLSLKAAASIFARVEETLGGTVTPDAILAVPPARLRRAGLSDSKVRSLRELAEAVTTGELNLLALKRVSPEEALIRLSALYGIGPWTAEMFLIFALGAPDIFSPGDLILVKQMQKHLSLDGASRKELAVHAERWSPYRSYVSLLLWKLSHEDN